VRLHLLRDGAEPKVVTTEFDGTALFGEVPAGKYRLELDPAQAERLRMRLAAPVSVVVAADGQPTEDVTLNVLFDKAPDKGRVDDATQ
jgi:FtsP/CotA-like multicopper oxidase with cupredoxin domain